MDDMDGILSWIRAVEIIIRGGFLLFLSVAGYQDLKEQKVRVRLFMIFGSLGTAFRGIQMVLELKVIALQFGQQDLLAFAGKRLEEIGLAVMIGGILLVISAITKEAIGRGDGWFFVVSGIYLGFAKNVLLLCGGLLFCFLACAVLFMKGILDGRDARRQRLPFIPFLIPAGLGVMFL